METSIAATDAGPVAVDVLYRRGTIIVHQSVQYMHRYTVTHEPTRFAVTADFLTEGGAKRFADFVSRTAVAEISDPDRAKELPRNLRYAVKRKAQPIHRREMAISGLLPA